MHTLAPCDWDLIYAECEDSGTCSHLESMPEETAEAVVGAATTWLWEATLRRYGNCPVTILPCKRTCSGYGSWPAFVPFRSAGGWVNVSCGRCGIDCSCSAVDQIVLPTIGDVLGVESHGVPLPAEAWRLVNHRILVRLDGGTWPTCQNLDYAETPDFTVIYIPGLAVPAQGQLAAGSLACQLARRYCGAKCDLPATATAVSRQGVSITLDPVQSPTGLWVVDQWVELVNRAIPTVRSPDLPTVWTHYSLTSP